MSGKHLTSPKGKGGQPQQPSTLKSFHEEPSPKLKMISTANAKNKSKMINAQSTESLESLSDEMTSNSGGTNRTLDMLPGRVRDTFCLPAAAAFFVSCGLSLSVYTSGIFQNRFVWFITFTVTGVGGRGRGGGVTKAQKILSERETI